MSSLLGTFTGADAINTSAQTTGSRTTTSGSLITCGAAGWDDVTGQTVTVTDSKSNSYTEPFESEFGSGSSFVNYGISYNIGGTRGASHTVTNTVSGSGSFSNSVTAQEWDGIASSPTVDTGTAASSTSTSPSCSVTPSGGSALVVAMLCYDGATTTIAVSDGTQASEQDEDNSSQAQNVAYKTGATGATTIAWTLGASRLWGCRAVAFSETAAGRTTKNTRSAPLGVNVGMGFRMGV